MKNKEKKGKVEHVLLYRFLNDENSFQVMSSGKKKCIWPHVLGKWTLNFGEDPEERLLN